MSTRLYRKSPIQEALCEFYFEKAVSKRDIDALTDRFKGEFPEKRTFGGNVVQFQFNPDQPIKPESHQIPEEEQRIQYLSKSKDTLFQVERNMLAVNKLQPYESFEIFYPTVEKVLDGYCEQIKPKQFVRTGIQKINRIVIDRARFDPEEYFEWYMKIPFQDAVLINYAMQTSVSLDNGAILKLSLSPLPLPEDAQKEKFGFIFDLYYINTLATDINLTTLRKTFFDANDVIHKWFDACLTEKLKEQFEPYN